MKGMTRDDYNDQMASILKHKKNLQPKAKRKRSKTNLRRSGRTPGKHDGISTRSSRYKPIIAKGNNGNNNNINDNSDGNSNNDSNDNSSEE